MPPSKMEERSGARSRAIMSHSSCRLVCVAPGSPVSLPGPSSPRTVPWDRKHMSHFQEGLHVERNAHKQKVKVSHHNLGHALASAPQILGL